MYEGCFLALTFVVRICKLLSSKRMVKGLPYINAPNNICKECVLDKYPGRSFPKESYNKVKIPLQLIYTDICRPIIPSSFGGHHYFLTFINDFSKKIWVYLLKEKLETFQAFKKFKALVENQSGYTIKVLWSDHGKKFTSKKFEAFCKYHGI